MALTLAIKLVTLSLLIADKQFREKARFFREISENLLSEVKITL